MPRLVIAIDGPSGAGKSTVGRRLAAELGYTFIDTGAMYRALALAALRADLVLDDGEALARLLQSLRIELGPAGEVQLDGEDVAAAIRTSEVSAASSRVSVHTAVRREMVRQQQALGRSGGVVLDGRDIGTAVFPEADVKFYVDADPARRAARRYAERQAAGLPAERDVIERETRARDHADMTRADSPLTRAPDAILIDTGERTADEVLALMLAQVRRRQLR